MDGRCVVPGFGGSSVRIGPGEPLVVIAGPCALESRELGLEVGRVVRDACRALGLGYVFKASFDKANRTSVDSPRGPGLERGLEDLAAVGEALGVPVTTDVHHPEQAAPAAAVAGLLQVPAFLCRQTDLLVACAEAASSRAGGGEGGEGAVNIKKGQFLSPQEMVGPVGKCVAAGCSNLLVTERGTFFGYHRLVNDFIGLGDLIAWSAGEGDGVIGGMGGNAGAKGPPVCFDATHSVQLPGASSTTGGRPERVGLLARSAAAAGVHAVFVECHPEPRSAASDAATMLALDDVPALLRTLASIRAALTDGGAVASGG